MKINSSLLTFGGTVLVILGSVLFMHSAWTSAEAGARGGSSQMASGGGGNWGPGPRILVMGPQDHQVIARDVGLTEAQRPAVNKLLTHVNDMDFEGRLAVYQQVFHMLAPEQQAIARQIMPGHVERMLADRDGEARRTLSPADYADFQQRLLRAEDRLQYAGERFQARETFSFSAAAANLPKH